MLRPSFNIKDIRKAAVEAFPELQLKIESLSITDLGKSLARNSPGITTQKLYKALQVDGRSFRPILVAGEQNGFISIEDGKLHLDT